MRYFILFFASFLLLILELNAQKTPGYRGKTVFFHYEAVPRLDYFDSEYDYYKEDGTAKTNVNFELKHNFGLHWTFAKNKIIGLDVTTTLGPRYFRSSYSSSGGELRSVEAYYIGLSYRTFFKKGGYIAPLGAYFELRPFVFLGKTFVNGNFESNSSQNVEPYTPLAVPKEITNPNFPRTMGLSFMFGNQWIVAERIIPSYSFGLTFYSGGFTGDFNYTGPALVFSAASLEYMSFDVKVGIGVLLF